MILAAKVFLVAFLLSPFVAVAVGKLIHEMGKDAPEADAVVEVEA